MNIKQLHERIADLATARENEKKWRKEMTERELDHRIAERNDDAEQIAAASKAHVEARTEWYGYYQASQDSAKGLVRHLGFEPSDIKAFL